MGDFFQRYVLANFGYKVISLALAIGLWWALSRDPVAEVDVTVPIEFHNIPSTLDISSVDISDVHVRVRGPERLIHEMREQDVHVEVDLTGVKPGERTFDLTARQVRQPRDLEVQQIIPSQVRLNFDTILTREVDVKPRVLGTFAPGYRIDKVLTQPSRISIRGPKQRVEAVDSATTDPVDASGAMATNTFVTNAFVADPLVQIVHPTPVRVTVIMEKAQAEPATQGKQSSE
jgi:YbbR domain-containing protein